MKTIITDIPGRDEYFKGKSWQLGYPWVTFGAIMALENLVNKDFRVLEFGSGGSTLFWAKNCQSVKTFETDSKWVGRVKRKTLEFPNVELIFASAEEIFEALKNEPDNYYDLVMVDNHPKHVNRLLLTNAAAPKVKIGGWLVLDNYQKHGLDTFDFSGWDVWTFDEIDFDGRGTKLCRKIK
jgi:precorrin-6B methylase 2